MTNDKNKVNSDRKELVKKISFSIYAEKDESSSETSSESSKSD